MDGRCYRKCSFKQVGLGLWLVCVWGGVALGQLSWGGRGDLVANATGRDKWWSRPLPGEEAPLLQRIGPGGGPNTAPEPGSTQKPQHVEPTPQPSGGDTKS